MSQRAKDLSKRIESFRDDVIAYVDALTGEEWNAGFDWEVRARFFKLKVR